MSISHPLTPLLSQSACAVSHVGVHFPATQAFADAPAALQLVSQVPQCRASVASSASQPSAGSPLQSAEPVRQRAPPSAPPSVPRLDPSPPPASTLGAPAAAPASSSAPLSAPPAAPEGAAPPAPPLLATTGTRPPPPFPT